MRRIARSAPLSIAAILCIALGTAATSATLTLVSATLLRPLPFPQAERLVRVWLQEPDGEERIELSYPDLKDIEAHIQGLDAVEAAARARLLYQGRDGARRIEGEAVTEGYFDLLGVEPLLGRRFTAEEHLPGGDRVVLLDYRAWGSIFAFDESVVGRTLRTDGGEYTVVGVLPQSFIGSIEADSGDIEVWLPIDDYWSAERRERRDAGGIWLLGRLAPGSTMESVDGEAEALAHRLARRWPETHRGRNLRVEPLGENWRAAVRRGSLVALAAGLVLLLVAAINVAGLLLARSLDDRRDTAIRSALGAGRRRMLGQVLLETLLLVGPGCLLGLVAGPPLLRAVVNQPSLIDGGALGLPVFVRFVLDPAATALAVLAFFVTALVAASSPALVMSRVDPAQMLQEGGRSTAGSRRANRWSRNLVLAEVVLTTVLVLASALLLRSYHALGAQDLGFRTEGLLRIALFIHQDDVPEDARLPAFLEHLRAEMTAIPGVGGVGAVWPTVPIEWPVQETLTTSAFEAGSVDGGLRVGMYVADPAFFELLEVPVLAGRGLAAGDGPGASPVAVVSRSLARRLGGSQGWRRVVGAEARLGATALRIVGVVGDTRYGGPRQESGASYEIYLPLAQAPQRLMTLLFETSGDPATLVSPLERRLAALAPASAREWSGPLDRWVSDLYLHDERFLLSLVGLFTAASLVLTAVGLFAQLAHRVARRRAEMAIRQALGATPRAIEAMVVAEALRIVGLGLGIGALGGWLAAGALESFVRGISKTDPWSLAATAALLLAVAVAASFLPARRAAGTAPAEILRGE